MGWPEIRACAVSGRVHLLVAAVGQGFQVLKKFASRFVYFAVHVAFKTRRRADALLWGVTLPPT